MISKSLPNSQGSQTKRIFYPIFDLDINVVYFLLWKKFLAKSKTYKALYEIEKNLWNKFSIISFPPLPKR